MSSAEDYLRVLPSVGDLLVPLLAPSAETDSLLAYQRAGVEWLLERPLRILADDMGLGKTLQALMAAARLLREGALSMALIVAPRTVLATWEAEVLRWAPDLTRLRVTPESADRERVWRSVWDRVHLLVTNYEQLREPPAIMRERGCALVIADEAHRIRNFHAQATRGFRQISFERFWALSGTPIERDSADLATLLSILDPARFSLADARLPPAALRGRAGAYMLRRRKEDVLDDLPDVLESKEILELGPKQRAAYDAELRKVRRAAAGDALRLVNELRQLCDVDPESGDSVKAERITEHLKAIREQGEKAVVFSTFLEPLRALAARLRSESSAVRHVILTGDLDVFQRDRVIKAFRSDPQITVLLASTRAGGEGITLTEANHVLFFNEWWNPSTDAQARDRVVRIGQRRGVRVYRFRCLDTIEQSLDRILETKQELFARVVDQLANPTRADSAVIPALLEELRRPATGPG